MMEKAMVLVSVLLLGWTWTLQGVLVDGVEPSIAPADVENATLLNTTLFSATEVCKQIPPMHGAACTGNFSRYFFNSSSMSCQLFIYGGCGGNRNNFETEKECMQTCHSEEVCKQIPPTDGPTCLGIFPRYFYNSTSMSCQLFIYGGCGGNHNNFETEKECMQTCHSEEVCKQIPPTDGPTCLGIFPRYFYNSTSMSCQLFIYGGCGGNRNNFETEKECMQRCHTE